MTQFIYFLGWFTLATFLFVIFLSASIAVHDWWRDMRCRRVAERLIRDVERQR